MKYYIIEEIVEYGLQVSRPLCAVEKEEIAKDIINRYSGLTYIECETKETNDESKIE